MFNSTTSTGLLNTQASRCDLLLSSNVLHLSNNISLEEMLAGLLFFLPCVTSDRLWVSCGCCMLNGKLMVNGLFWMRPNRVKSQLVNGLFQVLVSLIGKILYGCIRDLGFNSHLYQKLIGMNERERELCNCGISVNALLTSTFWPHFHFGLYFSILPFLVLKMKNWRLMWSFPLTH